MRRRAARSCGRGETGPEIRRRPPQGKRDDHDATYPASLCLRNRPPRHSHLTGRLEADIGFWRRLRSPSHPGLLGYCGPVFVSSWSKRSSVLQFPGAHRNRGPNCRQHTQQHDEACHKVHVVRFHSRAQEQGPDYQKSCVNHPDTMICPETRSGSIQPGHHKSNQR